MKPKNFLIATAKSIVMVLMLTVPLFINQSCQKDVNDPGPDMELKSTSLTGGEAVIYWGNEKFTRGNGEPMVVKMKIGSEDLVQFEPTFTLRIQNGDGSINLVSSAIIKIDGKPVFGVSDFSQAVKSLSKEITGLTVASEIEVEVRGIPGSYLDIWIEGTLLPGKSIVDESGGEVISENGLLKITIPASAVNQRTIFSITPAEYPDLDSFNEELIGQAYHLEPHGFQFLEAVKITLGYDPDLFPDPENIMVLHWFVPGEDYDVIVPAIDKEKNEISFYIEHLSGVSVFKKSNSGTFIDERDGNQYNWVKIGNQIWMAENLAYLPAVSPPYVHSQTEKCYYVYGYTGTDATDAKATLNYATYGVLYNWRAAFSCPPGWHLPNDLDWKQLEMVLGMTQAEADLIDYRGTDQGTKMKATDGWPENGNGTNTSGFSGLPGGTNYAYYGFYGILDYGAWWSSSAQLPENAWVRQVYYNGGGVSRSPDDMGSGNSVRCIKD